MKGGFPPEHTALSTSSLGPWALVSLAFCVALLLPGWWSAWALGLAGVTLPLVLVGLVARSWRGGLAWAVLGLWLVAFVAIGAILADVGQGFSWAGLPTTTWWMLVGLGLLPWLAVPILHALAYRSRRSGAAGR